MKSITCTITGKTPLLMHKFTDAAAMSATDANRATTVGDRGTPREQAEASLYLDNKNRPMIPQPNMFRCIMDAGKFFKAGRSKVTTQKSSMIPACLEIEELCIALVSKDGWEVDTRPIRIPATGGRILRHRPMFNDWALSFTMQLDTTLIGVKLLRDIVDAAGKRVGLGDFRPDCKGPYGKFVVTHWVEEENE